KLKALDYAKKKRVPLVFDKELPVQIVIGYNPHLYNNQILSTLPNPLFIDENTNILSDDFVELILNYNPEAIIMWNPYGRPWRLEVYRKLKIMNKKIIVAERGALPNSIYFDENGLCVESSSYSEDKWNYNLNFE